MMQFDRLIERVLSSGLFDVNYHPGDKYRVEYVHEPGRRHVVISIEGEIQA